MELTPANLPLVLEDCDAQALGDVLAARDGAALDIDGAHELLGSLIELRDAESGESRAEDQSGLLPTVIEIGGVTLQTPTLAARIALQRFDHMHAPAAWADYTSEYVALVVAWVLAHGSDPIALGGFREETAETIVERWAASITCTSQELSEAVYRLMRDGYPPMQPGDKSRKKAMARPTMRCCWLAWPKRFLAWTRSGLCIMSPKRMCTGFAGLVRSALARRKAARTTSASVPTTPASTPANGGSGSGNDSPETKASA